MSDLTMIFTNVISFTRRNNQLLHWIALLSLVLIAFLEYTQQSMLLKGISLFDTGRDVLIAKRLATNASLVFAAPWSTVPWLQNTPFYYWISAVSYRIFGLFGITVTTVVGMLSFLLVMYVFTWTITKQRLLALSVVFFIVFSSFFNGITAKPWQPNLLFLFTAVVLQQFYRAVSELGYKRFFLTVFSTIPLVLLHNSGLPVAMLVLIFLGMAYRKKISEFKNKIYTYIFGLTLFLPIILWFVLVVFSAREIYTVKLFTDYFFQARPNISEGILVDRILHDLYVPLFGSNEVGVTVLGLCIFSIVLAMILQYIKGPLPKPAILLLASIVFSVFMVLIVPGKKLDWYFYPQMLVVFLLTLLLPWLLLRFRWWWVAQVIWLLFLARNLVFVNHQPELGMVSGFAESQIIANAIDADISALGIHKQDFTIGIRELHRPESDLTTFISTWNTASIQIALEEINPAYETRVKVLTHAEHWANIREPTRNNYYLVCYDLGEKPLETCVSKIEEGAQRIQSTRHIKSLKTESHGTVAVFYLRLTAASN